MLRCWKRCSGATYQQGGAEADKASVAKRRKWLGLGIRATGKHDARGFDGREKGLVMKKEKGAAITVVQMETGLCVRSLRQVRGS
jgi:hypothetical protein